MPVSEEVRKIVVENFILCRKNRHQTFKTVNKILRINCPCLRTVYKIINDWETSNGFEKVKRKRVRTVLTPETLALINENCKRFPRVPATIRSANLGLCRTTFRNGLKIQGIKAYKPFKAHKLTEQHKLRRLEFCQWFVQKFSRESIKFPIIFSDEAYIELSPSPNSQNVRIYSKSRPVEVSEQKENFPKKLGLWCALSVKKLYGPYVFEGNVDSSKYISIIKTFLEDVDRISKRNFWFQQDGATCHTSRESLEFLTFVFPGRVISGKLETFWPPHSPDLNPLDFYFWGSLKSYLSHQPASNLTQLRSKITEYATSISQSTLQRVNLNFEKRVQKCIEANGGHFEHLL